MGPTAVSSRCSSRVDRGATVCGWVPFDIGLQVAQTSNDRGWHRLWNHPLHWSESIHLVSTPVKLHVGHRACGFSPNVECTLCPLSRLSAAVSTCWCLWSSCGCVGPRRVVFFVTSLWWWVTKYVWGNHRALHFPLCFSHRLWRGVKVAVR